MHFPSEVRERLMNLASSTEWPSLPATHRSIKQNKIDLDKHHTIKYQPISREVDHLNLKNQRRERERESNQICPISQNQQDPPSAACYCEQSVCRDHKINSLYCLFLEKEFHFPPHEQLSEY